MPPWMKASKRNVSLFNQEASIGIFGFGFFQIGFLVFVPKVQFFSDPVHFGLRILYGLAFGFQFSSTYHKILCKMLGSQDKIPFLCQKKYFKNISTSLHQRCDAVTHRPFAHRDVIHMIFNFVSETDTLMETDFIKATESGKKGMQEFTKVNLFLSFRTWIVEKRLISLFFLLRSKLSFTTSHRNKLRDQFINEQPLG